MSTTDTYVGAKDIAVVQIQPSIRGLPGSPAGRRIKYDELTVNPNPVRSANNTIQGQVVQNKMDQMDEEPAGTITAAMCLNDFGVWLKLHCGSPVSVAGTGGDTGKYVHTFTYGAGVRPVALLDLAKFKSGGGSVMRQRMLGMLLNQFTFDPLGKKQQWQGQLMFAQESLPEPSTAWDGAADFYPYAIAATHRASITDGGANVLGQVSACSISSNLNVAGVPLADGERGYGAYVVGNDQLPALTGSLSSLFVSNDLWLAAKNNSSTTLICTSATADGSARLTTTVPAIAFSKQPDWQSNLASGAKVIATEWYAHHSPDPITFVLVNSVTAY